MYLLWYKWFGVCDVVFRSSIAQVASHTHTSHTRSQSFTFTHNRTHAHTHARGQGCLCVGFRSGRGGDYVSWVGAQVSHNLLHTSHTRAHYTSTYAHTHTRLHGVRSALMNVWHIYETTYHLGAKSRHELHALACGRVSSCA